ncbi:sulfatase [Roseibacillus ishigakijimensis]|uniref:Sulfatase n=1 Tax=Roseibacillus ishigakijimensis TaxID=454146 RepID=A0A934RNB7_9BACT|nr:sulfatase [Roseibacillus ishigakijimensis]MBK1833950.1 sulfatase [Roseibacillus ishigakijimensis]
MRSLLLLLASTLLLPARPNVVLLLVDDLGYSDLACYGNPLHETPHLDQLAREGMRYTDAYAACAVCSPSRAAIQTGQYPIRHGLTDWIAGSRLPNTPLKERFTHTMLPLEEVTIAEHLRAHDYRTAFIGKWHLNDHGHQTGFPQDQGYQINLGGHHKGQPPHGYFAPFKIPFLPDRGDDDYLTDRLGDEATRLLADYAQSPDEPFFLMLSFYTVHTPIQPKPALQKHYQEKIAALPPSPWKNAAYAAMVHSMDENVGRVLTALEEHDLAEDTLVIMTSDNGGLVLREITSNHPLAKGKGFYHEGGIRVPLILRQPGLIPAGKECAQPVFGPDLFPTILTSAGLPPAPERHRDGLDLSPTFVGEDLPKRALYWHYPHYHGSGETPASAIRMGDYKFIRHYQDGVRELYHLRDDVGERVNLVDSQPEKARELEEALDAWLDEHQAYRPVPDPSYDPTKPYRPRR